VPNCGLLFNLLIQSLRKEDRKKDKRILLKDGNKGYKDGRIFRYSLVRERRKGKWLPFDESHEGHNQP